MNIEEYYNLKERLQSQNVELIAVSKTKSEEAIMSLYDCGQRHFGENRVQELVGKQDTLPKDINWHMIGHLQRNKVKYIASFVSLIHAIDSHRLLVEVNKQAKANNRVIDVLVQIHIAQESSKFGISPEQSMEFFTKLVQEQLDHVRIVGLMTMASFVQDKQVIREEFNAVTELFQNIKSKFYSEEESFRILSMGMSSDYELAMESGSNMIRVGSLLFGSR